MGKTEDQVWARLHTKYGQDCTLSMGKIEHQVWARLNSKYGQDCTQPVSYSLFMVPLHQHMNTKRVKKKNEHILFSKSEELDAHDILPSSLDFL